MKCDRCGADASVGRHDVDGFTGLLCEDCVETWDRIQSEGSTGGDFSVPSM
jgi:hypothetical protein